MIQKLRNHLKILLIFGFLVSSLSGSNISITNSKQLMRMLTRNYEFNFFDWTLEAAAKKIVMGALNLPDYLSTSNKELVINDYLYNRNKISELKFDIQMIYTDPNINDVDKVADPFKSELSKSERFDSRISPFVEQILSQQIIMVLNENHLTLFGMIFPPLLFEISELPENLIISPRDRIEQINSISLIPKLDIQTINNLETKIDSDIYVSSLVVPIGGLGSYPTMIESTSSLQWIINTIIHEWIHNWLVFRPLGWNYGKSYELRTMNETTASIIGNELEIIVLKEYYPETYSSINNLAVQPPENIDTDSMKVVFDYNDEMRVTRVEVNSLLTAGKIEEAERYMEFRREVFWDNGYQIRKINQAFFAFYGAYADVPGGAAGDDPIGPAVRKLREQSMTISEFLIKISRFSSFQELITAIE